MAAPKKPLGIDFLRFLQQRRPEYLLQIGIIDRDRLAGLVDGLMLLAERNALDDVAINTAIERLMAEVAGSKAQQLLRRRYAEWKHEQTNKTVMLRVKPGTRDSLVALLRRERFDSVDELIQFLVQQHERPVSADHE